MKHILSSTEIATNLCSEAFRGVRAPASYMHLFGFRVFFRRSIANASRRQVVRLHCLFVARAHIVFACGHRTSMPHLTVCFFFARRRARPFAPYVVLARLDVIASLTHLTHTHKNEFHSTLTTFCWPGGASVSFSGI